MEDLKAAIVEHVSAGETLRLLRPLYLIQQLQNGDSQLLLVAVARSIDSGQSQAVSSLFLQHRVEQWGRHPHYLI